VELADAVLANRPGMLKLPRLAPRRTPNSQRLPIEIKLLNAMITVLANKDMTFAVEHKVVRITQATSCRSGLPKRLDEHGTLPDGFTVFAPLINKLAVGIELLDSVEVSVLRNVEVTFGVLHNIGDETKLAWPTSIDPADGQLGEHFALGRVEEDPKVMRIANHQLVVLTYLQPARLSRIAFRRSPITDEFSIPVKNLNSSRLVDDKNLVLLVDRDCSRFDKPTVVEAFAAPDERGFCWGAGKLGATRYRNNCHEN